ncbi:MAG: transposase [Steroidobacteraceae bacterium]
MTRASWRSPTSESKPSPASSRSTRPIPTFSNAQPTQSDDPAAYAACLLIERKKVRTTNAIERRFREVRRRTRPMGVFSDRTSMDRILFAVFNHENRNQGVSTPLLLTQTL